MAALNNEIFINRAKKIHGDKYDYSLVDYKNSFIKVKIICRKHGLFEQNPSVHTHVKRHSGCPKCGKELIGIKNSLSTEDIINRAIKVHGDRYDYSLVNYKYCTSKVKIICRKHGVFEQTVISHILQARNCPICSAERRCERNRINTDAFIEKAKKVHGERYDYSLVEYLNSNTKIKIICKKHGVFNQIPRTHLSGKNCFKCGIEIKNKKINLSTLEFIERSIKVHGNKYDYSLIDYKRCNIKVEIICHKHGVFEQIPTEHLRGQDCLKCSNERIRKNALNSIEYIKRAVNVHGYKYNYSLVNYKGRLAKIKIICPKHGVFEQMPRSHLKNRGCLKCALETISRKLLSNTDEFIRNAIKMHGNKYDYSLVDYKRCNIKVKIICHKHGVFLQNTASHLRGTGCPHCLGSSGEQKVASFLDSYGISYKREAFFEDCKRIKNLLFDFYIPILNTCIEYDGEQHFFPSAYFGGIKAFENLKISDSIKNDFCYKNGINLIRLSYKQKDSEIISILKEEILKPSMQV